MGLHIKVRDYKHKGHPNWECIRCAHDKEFPELVWETGILVVKGEEGFRLNDIPKLHELIDATDWENKKRFHGLLDIFDLDIEQRWRLYFSV